MRVVRFSFAKTAILGLSLFLTPLAQSQQSPIYPQTGTVKLLVFGMGTFKNTEYVITTNHAIYRAQCTPFKSDQPQEPDCSFDHKPIADGAIVSFRKEGDSLLLPAGEQASEQRLLIVRTELNPYPETPAPGTNGVSNGVVVAVDNLKNHQAARSLTSARCASQPARPVESTTPLNSTSTPPVEGTAPFGGIVGGVMTANQQGDMACMMSQSRLLDSFKLITSDRVYEVTCTNEGPCQVNGQPLSLGAKYFVRVDSPNMWISTDSTQFSSKSEFHVISGLLYPENR